MLVLAASGELMSLAAVTLPALSTLGVALGYLAQHFLALSVAARVDSQPAS